MEQTVHKLIRGLAVCLLLWSFTSPLQAQVYIMGRGRNSMFRIIQPMKLSKKEIKAYSNYSVADAVRYYSGVQFKDYNGLGGFKTINVRSLGSERMGVFYNGIEISSAMNGQVDLTKFSMDNVESLTIFSGQKGDIFQTATDFASAGSLYIESRRPQFTGTHQSVHFKAGLKGGSFLYINPSLLIEKDLGHYITTSINWNMVSSEGNYPFRYKRYNGNGKTIYDEKGLRRNDRYHANHLEGSLHGIFGMGMWNVYAYVNTSDRGVPGAIVNNVWYKGERLTERNYFVQGNVKFDVTPKYRTLLNFKVGHDYVRYENNDDKIRKVDNSFKEYDAYISSSHLITLMREWKLSAAYDLHYNFMTKRNELKDRSARNFARPWRLKHLLSIATQGSWHSLTGQASVLGTYVQNFGNKTLNPYKNEMAVSPTAMITYKPFRRINFNMQAFVKQTYQVPNYNDRYISEVLGETLKPENMLQYDFGLVYAPKGDGVFRELNCSVEAYYEIIKDKIIAYPQGQLYRWTMTNLGKVQILGGNAMAKLVLRFGTQVYMTTKVQYTYEQARDITNKADTYYNMQIPNIPWHSGSAILGLSWHGWALNYSFLYVGKRYSRQENIPYYEMQPWYTHDLSISKLFKKKPKEQNTINGVQVDRPAEPQWVYRCMLEVNNVLGDDFEIVPNYPMPRQIVRLTVTAEI